MTPTVFSTPVEASPPIGIGPLWLYTDNVALVLTYNSGTVSWVCDVSGSPQCDSINATCTLTKNSNPAQSHSSTAYGRWWYYSGSYAGGPGTYTLSVDAVITSTTGGTETIHREITRTFQ
ncbi:MAG: hypothetical protein LBM41_08190 [Ruminococcus sp.]|nr:hypothetical protein [Ruminococcus sp.]